MKNTLITFSTMVLLISCGTSRNSTSSNERPSGPRGERPSTAQLMSQMDSNKDGKISENEAQGPIAEQFSNIDRNRDGYLTEAELSQAEPQRGNRPPRQNQPN